MPDVDEATMVALVGHKFPGGTRRVEHWENWLLTDCTGSEQLPDGLIHPISMFHVPIQGVGTSIADLFALGQVDGAGSVGLDGYDWEYFQPLQEDVDYAVEGSVLEIERMTAKSGGIYDRFVFAIEMRSPDGELAARVTNHWRFRRDV